jgi:F-type H+-transporting ATPase subunit epsilon
MSVKNILNLRIYTPQKLFLEEKIVKMHIFEKENNYTILPRHIDYLTSFNRSTADFEKLDGEKVYLWLNQGILVKCGREIQISVFSAINGGNSRPNLKKEIENSQKHFKNLVESSKKFKTTLRNIESKITRIG